MPSQEITPVEKVEQAEQDPSVAEIVDILSSAFHSTELHAGDAHSIDPLTEKRQEMGGSNNEGEGVYQSLRALIKAGEDIFGVADVFIIDRSNPSSRPEFIEGTVITHYKPNRRAELVGFIDKGDKPITIGRSMQPNLDLSPTTSRRHFSVAQSGEGIVTIEDDSSNGTTIFEPSMDSDKTKNKINNFDFWSVKSGELKDSFLKRS